MNSSAPTKKPTLVVVLSRFPFPLEKGDKLRAYFQLRDLSKAFDITLICTVDKKVQQADYDEVAKFCQTIHIFQLNRIQIGIQLLRALIDNMPFQVRYFYQPAIQRKIAKILEELRPDHIFCQLIRTTEYVKHYHLCPKTLDYMDALSKGMERRYEQARFPMSRIIQSESTRLSQYERQVFDYFEHHCIISEQDKNFIVHPNRSSITVIPNGVNEHFLSPIPANKRYTILFTGNMSYQPNIDATLYLFHQLRPFLPTETSFLISGANPTKTLTQLNEPNFTVGGWVEDMRESYASAQLFVAPMMIGTGLQNKLLEAMAMGLPCITTLLCNNALQAKDGEEILIANTPEEFKSCIERLQRDPELYDQLSRAGKAFVTQHYAWKACNELLYNLIVS